MAESPKRIVLTGASRGLGRAMTAGFAAAGHQVIGCSRSPEAVAGLRASFAPPHCFDVVDVTSDDAVRQWAEDMLRDGDPPDLLVNNAAIIIRNAPLWEVTAEEFSQIVNVNICGVVNVLRRFVPAMVERGVGVIVNFSSTWGRVASPEVAPYCATKFAIEGLTQALAQELPSTMAAVPFNPGIINTEMLQSCFGAAAANYPNPEDWALRAVPYLLGLGPDDNGRSVSAPE